MNPYGSGVLSWLPLLIGSAIAVVLMAFAANVVATPLDRNPWWSKILTGHHLRAWLAERRLKKEWDREFEWSAWQTVLLPDHMEAHRMAAAGVGTALGLDDHDAHIAAATEYRDRCDT